MVVQWLRPYASNAEGMCSIPGEELRSYIVHIAENKKQG